MRAVLSLGCRIVVGTTGWYAHLDAMKAIAERRNASLLYGTNFSIGVQKLFRLTAELAKLDGYKFSITETHHTTKLDAPSGTAITLKQIIAGRQARRRDRDHLAPRRRRQGRTRGDRDQRLRCHRVAPRRLQPPRIRARRRPRRRVARSTSLNRRVGFPGNLRSAVRPCSCVPPFAADLPQIVSPRAPARIAPLRGAVDRRAPRPRHGRRQCTLLRASRRLRAKSGLSPGPCGFNEGLRHRVQALRGVSRPGSADAC